MTWGWSVLQKEDKNMKVFHYNQFLFKNKSFGTIQFPLSFVISFIHSFIFLFNKHTLSIYYVKVLC